MPSSNSSSNGKQKEDDYTHSNKIKEGYNPSGLSYAIAFCVLGASAGMTLYTRRTGQMLSRMEEYTANQLKRNPPKFGPPTRAEFEKMKNRWHDSD